MAVEPGEILRFGTFEFDVSRLELRRAGVLLKLQRQPAKLLSLLLTRGGETVTREEIQSKLWPDGTFVDYEQGINYSINQIRTALGDDAATSRFIQTVPRVGYRFLAGVERVEIAAGGAARAGDLPGPAAGESRKRHARSPRIPAYLAPVLLAGTVALFQASNLHTSSRLSVERTHGWFTPMRIRQLTGTEPIVSASISPDGRYLAYSGSDGEGCGLWLESLATETVFHLVGPQPTPIRAVGFTRDGMNVLYLSQETSGPGYSNLNQVSVLGGEPRRVVEDADSGAALSPDGKRFAFIRGRPDFDGEALMIAGFDGSGPVEIFTWRRPGGLAYLQPAWSPDGRRLAVVLRHPRLDSPFQILMVDARSGESEKLGATWWDSVAGMEWLPDGSGLVLAGEAQGVPDLRQLWRITWPEAQVTRLSNDIHSYRTISMTRTGDAFVTLLDSTVGNLWSVELGGEISGKQWTKGVRVEDFVRSARSDTEGAAMYARRIADRVELWRKAGSDDDARMIPLDHPPDSVQFDVSADGGTLAYTAAGDDGITHVFIATTAGDPALQVTNGEGETRPSACPGGEVVVYSKLTGQGLWKIDRRGGEPVRITDLPLGSDGPLCSPDGARVAFATSLPGEGRMERFIAVIPLEGGGEMRSFEWPAGRLLQWSPDGRALDFVVDTESVSNLWRLPLDGGAVRQLTRFQTGRIFSADWSPDGSHLFLSRGFFEAHAILVEDGT